VRGKPNKPVEFGAKLSISLTGDGFAHVDSLRWDAFHEGLDLTAQVEAYRNRYGHYPERMLADPIYCTRSNRDYLKQRGIHFTGKPLGQAGKHLVCLNQLHLPGYELTDPGKDLFCPE